MRLTILMAVLAAAAIAALPASARLPPTSTWDKEWLKTSISGDRFEIMGGHLALNKSSNPRVRALGARLIKDHTKSLHEALALAARMHLKAPKDPTPSMQWEIMMVSQLQGRSFDYNYSKLEVFDHSQDIEEAKSEAGEGMSTLVRKLAQHELPMLKMHLALSRRALSSSKAE